MPELPEVELMSRCLHRWCADRPLVGLDALDPRLGPVAQAAPTPATVRRVTRRAKLSLLHVDGQVLVLHFRMTGGICALTDAEDRPPHARLRLRLGGEGPPAVVLVDPRRFATALWLPEEELPAHLAALGPEPWPEPQDGEWWYDRLRGCTGPIKPALLQQERVAGIGNILATEALFLAHIDPRAPVQSLEPAQWSALAQVWVPLIDRILTTELASLDETTGISYVNAGGPNPFAVYGRAGEPCPRCATPLVRIVQAGRGTFLCESCQGTRHLASSAPQSLPARRSKARTRSSSSSGSKGLGR